MQLRLRRNIFGSMERLLLTPRPPLSQFVELIWYYRNHPLPHAKERMMPDGCCSLIINLQEDETRIYDPENTSVVTRSNGSGLSGPQTKCFAIDTEEQRWGPRGFFPSRWRDPFSKAASFGTAKSTC
jgi:hypothetical protein